MEKVRQLIDKDLIKIITGIRRCGKSYFLNMIINELKSRGIDEENILLIDLESPAYNYIEERRDLDEIVLKFSENNNDRKYLLLDEIQNVNEWEVSVNSYYKSLNMDIYITSSNSNIISGDYATYLTGRYIQIKIYPFSFNEFIDYKQELGSSPIVYDEICSQIENFFEEYINYGGLPIVLRTKEEDKNIILQDIYSSILFNEIIRKYTVRNIGLLTKIAEYIIEHIGELISVNSISNYLEVHGLKFTKNTVYTYINYLESAHILFKVQREEITTTNNISNAEKFYLGDTGLYNLVCYKTKKNRQQLLENIVYLELLRQGYKVTMGVIKNNELTFVCRKDNKKIYIKVTRTLSNKETYKREFRPLLEIDDNYPKYIISTDREDYSSKGIIHLNIRTFLRNFI